MKKIIVIDGRQLAAPIGGVQRYLREILFELDKIAVPGDYEILIPKKANIDVEYKNIKLVRYGLFNGLLWEQTDLPFYLLTRKCYGFFPCTIVPLLYPKGIALIHDIMLAVRSDLAEAMEKKWAKSMLLLNYKVAARRADVILTDSEYSKKDIVTMYGTDANGISIAGAGWQHILRVKSDDSWKKRYPQLEPNKFYFSLSANRKQKNFKWINEIAKKNPDIIFAMAGTREEWQKNIEYDAPNILCLGYVSDGEIRSLMENCKAFLFPSIYEGFGIPPLEALAVGAKIIVANCTCLPEIYQNSAYYIDPYDYDVDLDDLLQKDVAPAEDVLSRYGWDISAKKIHEIARKLIALH